MARQEFDYVVVDAGSSVRPELARRCSKARARFIWSLQAGISELRNSQPRDLGVLSTSGGPKLEIVLNRFMPRSLGIDEEHITKALTRPAQWKIPSDYRCGRRAQNTATPLALEDSPISRAIRQMARTAGGLPAKPGEEKEVSDYFDSRNSAIRTGWK